MEVQAELNVRALGQRGLLSRSDVLELGGSDGLIEGRVGSGLWTPQQRGVYLPSGIEPDWLQRLLAAVLAAGPSAVASHRAAWRLWELDGIESTPPEITVAYGNRARPRRAIRHRTRRPPELFVVRSIPCTGVERTLIDSGRFVSDSVIEIGVEDALKRRLTTTTRLWTVIDEQGGRGVPGAHRIRRVLSRRPDGPAAGSAAEVRFLQAMRKFGIPDPVRQFVVRLPNGVVYVVDCAWPSARLLVEIDGFKKRWDSRALDAFLERQNALLDAGFTLRRYGWRAITQRPENTARRIAALLHL